jgi:hypothetical protein
MPEHHSPNADIGMTETPTEGTVTIERGPATYTAKWAVTGRTLTVFFGGDKEAVILGMLENEPQSLARMLLAEMVERRLAGSR